ncbi:MAG: asparagine synthase C-terminal domain-containing protein [Acidobacteriota bacterium]|nr:asparagine synthase C-terminal domain-containing protein [Acidobacteriota bacterium]
MRTVTDTPLETYSIVFTDAEFDERAEQRQAVEALGTEHFQVEVDYEAIARAFEQVVFMAEKPILRTAPVPLFLLSGLVRGRSRKVVLTGEGADELFGGYDIFKETKIRAWWGRRPESRLRPRLLHKLYPFAPGASGRAAAFFEAFYREGIENAADPGFSHRPTWRNGVKNRGFFSPRMREVLKGHDVPGGILERFAAALAERDPLARAEYLEARVFLAGHLLSSQGDRMSLGHSVEGRYPFLDHRIVEWSARLDPRLKLRGLQEKWILRQAHADLLPESLLRRHKRPYIAPNTRTFRDGFGRRLAEELLSEEAVLREGLFDPGRLARLRAKAFSPTPLGERETMALVGVLSTHSLARTWRRWRPDPVPAEDFHMRGLSTEEKQA